MAVASWHLLHDNMGVKPFLIRVKSIFEGVLDEYFFGICGNGDLCQVGDR